MKEKDPEEKKEVTEEEKTKEEKPEAKGVKEEVTLARARSAAPASPEVSHFPSISQILYFLFLCVFI